MLPDTVTKIESYVFKGCTGLKTIVMPVSLAKSYAWLIGVNDTVKIYFKGGVSDWDGKMFLTGQKMLRYSTIRIVPTTYPRTVKTIGLTTKRAI